MTLSAGNDLFYLKKEMQQQSDYNRNHFLDKNDFLIVGKFIKQFWLSDSFWEIREKLNLNLCPEKELNKYSFMSLSLFWMMIHEQEYLAQSFIQKGQSAQVIPQFPEGFTFAKMIQYLPKGMIQNIRYYLENNMPLFLHLAQGNNIRNYAGLPFSLSKKVAHYCFEYLSQSESFENSIKKAMLKSWGAKDGQMYDCLDLDFKYFNGDYWKFIWQTAFRNEAKIREIIPLHYIITHFIDTFDEGHFSHKNDLEKEIVLFLKAELKRQKASTWNFADFAGYSITEEDAIYKIIQLDNPRLLHDEGKAMSHCVGTYIGNCKYGRCSIWSLRSYRSNGKEHRIATIEVSRTNKLIQVKAKANKRPKSNYRDIILEWAIQENLTYAAGIF